MRIVKIRDILKQKNRSVSWLQRETGISKYSLDLIVKELKSPTTKQIKKIAEALDVSVSEILWEFVY